VFSGIVETTSPVLSVSHARKQRILTIRKPRGWMLQDGESVSIEGVCSTVQSFNKGAFRVVYMPETLRKTTLGGLQAGDEVNLERCLNLQSLIGGHLVQGHVDTTARIKAITYEGEARLFTFAIPARFSRYIVPKGSIAVDGISLTVVEATRSTFQCSLLAYTLSHTTLGGKRPGRQANIEVDILGKYIERLLKK
jgi:riboflavin synthase